MPRKKALAIIFTGIVITLVIMSYMPHSSEQSRENYNAEVNPRTSASVETMNNILITQINRDTNLSGYGLMSTKDTLTVKNINSNPIEYFFIGVPLTIFEDLVEFKAEGKDANTLLSEKTSYAIDKFQLIAIYFEEPLLPYESTTVNFYQVYKDMLTYSGGETSQTISLTIYVYPILPYKAEGDISAKYNHPESSEVSEKDWGTANPDDYVEFKIADSGVSYLEPLLSNLGTKQNITLVLTDSTVSKLEFTEVTRDIFISPWSIIKVKESYIIKNTGLVGINSLKMQIPGNAKNVYISDDLGEIMGIEVSPNEGWYNLTYKDLNIDLSVNRATITPDSKFKFYVQYTLAFEKYFSVNWFQESIKIDLLTSIYEFLGKEQTVKVIIDGCYKIDYLSQDPDAIEQSENIYTLIYETDYVTPLDRNPIEFTFTLNIINLLFRPIIFMIIIASIASVFVLRTKTKKEAAEKLTVFKKEAMPVNEIREFCSLYDEKSALLGEISKAEENLKRKKIPKKTYNNIIEKNTSRIDQITKESISFRKILSEVGAEFSSVVKNLEILEAERVSVKDSINVLETRYKRGRLPSKTAYEQLLEEFNRRIQKIDRSIDKLVQQMRTYLL